jgi:hypothetical protein
MTQTKLGRLRAVGASVLAPKQRTRVCLVFLVDNGIRTDEGSGILTRYEDAGYCSRPRCTRISYFGLGPWIQNSCSPENIDRAPSSVSCRASQSSNSSALFRIAELLLLPNLTVLTQLLLVDRIVIEPVG